MGFAGCATETLPSTVAENRSKADRIRLMVVNRMREFAEVQKTFASVYMTNGACSGRREHTVRWSFLFL